MKLLFHSYQITLGIGLFLLVWLKPCPQAAAFTLKIIANEPNLDVDEYAITLRHVRTHPLSQNTIKQPTFFSENISQTGNDKVLSFLLVPSNSTREAERPKLLHSLLKSLQDLRLNGKIKNSSLQAVVPILPQVSYKDIYKGIYDFDITIVDEPEQKYNFIIN